MRVYEPHILPIFGVNPDKPRQKAPPPPPTQHPHSVLPRSKSPTCRPPSAAPPPPRLRPPSVAPSPSRPDPVHLLPRRRRLAPPPSTFCHPAPRTTAPAAAGHRQAQPNPSSPPPRSSHGHPFPLQSSHRELDPAATTPHLPVWASLHLPPPPKRQPMMDLLPDHGSKPATAPYAPPGHGSVLATCPIPRLRWLLIQIARDTPPPHGWHTDSRMCAATRRHVCCNEAAGELPPPGRGHAPCLGPCLHAELIWAQRCSSLGVSVMCSSSSWARRGAGA
ncbi:extensin [Triticum aestivum]|uniref:extensin n=1 Tax=Triticum aestivum TaxID=4565 RepID=UPI001D014A79|nr:extensin-like [Triticum aestivum]